MKRNNISVVALLLMLLCCSACDEDNDSIESQYVSSDYGTNVYKIRDEHNKFGLIDNQGNIVVEPRFDSLDKFYYGLACFRMRSEDHFFYNYGFINPKGEIVIEHSLDSACRFSDAGLARASKDGKVGYIDVSGNMALEVHYQQKGDFHEGLASVMLSGKWGFINTTGALVIEPKFRHVYSFCNGYCVVQTEDGNYNFIDKSGELISLIDFEDTSWFSTEGLAAVKVNGSYYYIDTSGEIAFKGSASDAEGFHEGLASVQNDDEKWGFINSKGDLVIDYQFDRLWGGPHFCEGLACVKKDGLCGYINKSGSFVIPPRYISANDFVNGIARVFLVEKSSAYIDMTGEIIYKGRID